MVTKCKLSPVALGLSLGVFWGLGVFIMGLVAAYFMFGTPFVTAMGSVYVGYEATLLGSFIGGLIAFVDAFIGGLIIAGLYNLFAGCWGKKCK
ncbi:MAG: bacteriophage holin [Legionellaceae bacterium]|nr:bacteriophage holin [Legionellaceae bacterium]